jgi:hypothetical protein
LKNEKKISSPSCQGHECEIFHLIFSVWTEVSIECRPFLLILCEDDIYTVDYKNVLSSIFWVSVQLYRKMYWSMLEYNIENLWITKRLIFYICYKKHQKNAKFYITKIWGILLLCYKIKVIPTVWFFNFSVDTLYF